MLSPVPAASRAPPSVSPGWRPGPARPGPARRRPGRAAAGRGGRSRWPATSSRCRWRRPGRWPASSPGAPASRQVSQSWGRQTAATRAASGSWSASQRSLVTVALGPGPRPAALGGQVLGRPGPAGVVPEQGRADHLAGLVEQTMPCCWAPTPTAATSSSPPAASIAAWRACSQAAGSTSVPSGWGARPSRQARRRRRGHDLAGLSGGVDPGDERQRRAPSRCSMASWSRAA